MHNVLQGIEQRNTQLEKDAPQLRHCSTLACLPKRKDPFSALCFSSILVVLALEPAHLVYAVLVLHSDVLSLLGLAHLDDENLS